jgi:hypothetical protein
LYGDHQRTDGGAGEQKGGAGGALCEWLDHAVSVMRADSMAIQTLSYAGTCGLNRWAKRVAASGGGCCQTAVRQPRMAGAYLSPCVRRGLGGRIFVVKNQCRETETSMQIIIIDVLYQLS